MTATAYDMTDEQALTYLLKWYEDKGKEPNNFVSGLNSGFQRFGKFTDKQRAVINKDITSKLKENSGDSEPPSEITYHPTTQTAQPSMSEKEAFIRKIVRDELRAIVLR